MDSQIIASIITATASIVTAIIGAWVAITLKDKELKAKETRTGTVYSQAEKKAAHWLWGVIGTIVGAVAGAGIILVIMSAGNLTSNSSSSQPNPTTNTDCIHPETLAQQNGWMGIELVDEYGGYRVQLNQLDQLPEFWEANGARKIHQLDSDRQMSAGVWIIYTPYDCRQQFGFAAGDKTSAECIHPEILSQQNGWTGLGLVDKYGGYQIQLNQNTQLPSLWEANGAKQIRQLDSDREMSPGVWTIYTPYSCREVLGFEK